LAVDTAIDLDLLLQEIDKKREVMIATALATGFTSEETVTCSQELDVLIMKYQEQSSYEKNKGVFKLVFNFLSLFPLVPIRVTSKIRS
jgi:hypothetical protein